MHFHSAKISIFADRHTRIGCWTLRHHQRTLAQNVRRPKLTAHSCADPSPGRPRAAVSRACGWQGAAQGRSEYVAQQRGFSIDAIGAFDHVPRQAMFAGLKHRTMLAAAAALRAPTLCFRQHSSRHAAGYRRIRPRGPRDPCREAGRARTPPHPYPRGPRPASGVSTSALLCQLPPAERPARTHSPVRCGLRRRYCDLPGLPRAQRRSAPSNCSTDPATCPWVWRTRAAIGKRRSPCRVLGLFARRTANKLDRAALKHQRPHRREGMRQDTTLPSFLLNVLVRRCCLSAASLRACMSRVSRLAKRCHRNPGIIDETAQPTANNRSHI